jgi:L-ascorbate metabolism protein UlaG (beta-lactamase superfamily)
MANDMHSKAIIPIHRNTFKLSVEKMSEPIERLKKALSDSTITL